MKLSASTRQREREAVGDGPSERPPNGHSMQGMPALPSGRQKPGLHTQSLMSVPSDLEMLERVPMSLRWME